MEAVKEYMQKICHRLTNTDRSVRIEDALRRSDEEQRRIKANIIFGLFLVVGVCIVIFLVGAYALLSVGLPYIKKVDLADVDMRLGVINDTSISIETKITLQPYLRKRINIKTYPNGATYDLTTSLSPITFAESKFVIGKEQTIVVKFEQPQIGQLPKETILLLKKRSPDVIIHIKIEGDFIMRIQLHKFIIFPYSDNHLGFGCKIKYKVFPDGKIISKKCIF